MGIRAFISYSHSNSEFADMLFSHLDQSGAILDKRAFDAGEPFGSEQDRKLADAGIFVILASPPALASRWVKLEIDQARTLRQAGIISKAIPILLGDSKVEDLPEWLRGVLAVRGENPLQVATIIRDAQKKLINDVQHVGFLNRFNELASCQSAINGRSTEPYIARHSIAFYGRPGFGRHELARKVFRDTLGRAKEFPIKFESGDNLPEIAAKLAQYADVYGSRDELRLVLDELDVASPSDLKQQVNTYLSTLAAENTLLIIEDAGGLLDRDGILNDAATVILETAEGIPGAYCVICSGRKPLSRGTLQPFSCGVSALSNEHGEDLAKRYRTIFNAFVSDEELAKLVEFIGGHPPSLRFAISEVHDKGIEIVLGNLDVLARHQIKTYWEDVRTVLDGQDQKQQVLVCLALYGPLSLMNISFITHLDHSIILDIVEDLITLVLVEPDSSSSMYRAPSALLQIAPRLFQDIRIDHERAFNALRQFIIENPGVKNRLLYERNLGRAFDRSPHPASDSDLIRLAADWIESADKAYSDERWDDALFYAGAAIERRPRNFEPQSIYVQSLVKKRDFEIAKRHVATNIIGNFDEQQVDYFYGFIARGEGNFREAIDHYARSISHGRFGFAIYREIADCYMRLGELGEADRELSIAKRNVRGRINRHVRDLDVKIRVLVQDEQGARDVLEVSRRIDKAFHYLVLLALVDTAFGYYPEAVTSLDRAVALRSRTPYLSIFLRAAANIAMGKFRDALFALQNIQGAGHERDKVALSVSLKWARGRINDAIDELGAGENRNAPGQRESKCPHPCLLKVGLPEPP
jgi:tetratricopeptide (TPR) repeat protein